MVRHIRDQLDLESEVELTVNCVISRGALTAREKFTWGLAMTKYPSDDNIRS